MIKNRKNTFFSDNIIVFEHFLPNQKEPQLEFRFIQDEDLAENPTTQIEFRDILERYLKKIKA